MAGANKVALPLGTDVSSTDALIQLVLLLASTLNDVVDDLETLRANFSAHTHVENTAAAYTQNATTNAGPTVAAAALTAGKLTNSANTPL